VRPDSHRATFCHSVAYSNHNIEPFTDEVVHRFLNELRRVDAEFSFENGFRGGVNLVRR
jgi:hypothetical protein